MKRGCVMFNFLNKKETVDFSHLGFGCLPSPNENDDEYIHFMDDNSYQIYKIIGGKKVVIRTESAPYRQVI